MQWESLQDLIETLMVRLEQAADKVLDDDCNDKVSGLWTPDSGHSD